MTSWLKLIVLISGKLLTCNFLKNVNLKGGVIFVAEQKLVEAMIFIYVYSLIYSDKNWCGNLLKLNHLLGYS